MKRCNTNLLHALSNAVLHFADDLLLHAAQLSPVSALLPLVNPEADPRHNQGANAHAGEDVVNLVSAHLASCRQLAFDVLL